SRPSGHPFRPPRRRRRRRPVADLRRGPDERLYEEGRDRHHCPCRLGSGLGHRLDLRPDQTLHRDQRGLSLVSEGAPVPTVPTVLVVAVALIDPDGRVLIAKRPEGKQLAGLWEFPCGKVEPGERPEQALIRELNEELGIDVNEDCLAPFLFTSHAYESFHLVTPSSLSR